MRPAAWRPRRWLHIRGMIEDGEPVPEPSKVDDIAKDAARRHAIVFLVRVEAPDATVRINITARESQMEKIDALAEAAGLTRSGYIVRAALGEGSRCFSWHWLINPSREFSCF